MSSNLLLAESENNCIKTGISGIIYLYAYFFAAVGFIYKFHIKNNI